MLSLFPDNWTAKRSVKRRRKAFSRGHPWQSCRAIGDNQETCAPPFLTIILSFVATPPILVPEPPFSRSVLPLVRGKEACLRWVPNVVRAKQAALGKSSTWRRAARIYRRLECTFLKMGTHIWEEQTPLAVVCRQVCSSSFVLILVGHDLPMMLSSA